MIGKIVEEKGKIAFFTRYDPQLVASIKDIKGRKWNPDDKSWIIPLTTLTASKILKCAEQFGIEVNADLRFRIEEKSNLKSVLQSSSYAASGECPPIAGLGGELRPFQRAGVAYALRSRRCFIADSMGLGKTIQALAVIAADALYPAVVVCPASVKFNWERESAKWIPNVRHGLVSEQKKILSDGISILTYGELSKWADLISEASPKALICDESHYCKSHKSIRSKLVKEIAKNIPVDGVVLCLTGTPITNRPAEFINQLQILKRLEELGGWKHFIYHYCDAKDTRWGLKIDGAAHLDELNHNMRSLCYIRREKSDVLKELPPKQRSVIPVMISNRHEYNQISEITNEWLRENKGLRSKHMEKMTKISACKHVAAQGKIASIVEWVQDFCESGEKLVLFADHISIQKSLYEGLSPLGCAHVFGEDLPEVRQNEVDRFQNDKRVRVIVVSLGAGSVGITLTASSNVAFAEMGWTPAIHDQAEDRVHRIGQSDSVTAWYFIGIDTVDEQIAKLIDKKRIVTSQAVVGDISEERIIAELEDILIGEK
jgi:SWI/SNF-related matrix-associated actin-dependent regulator 1 of chromatin subfamily A